MPEVLQVQPEGIMVTIKFSLNELVSLKRGLEMTKIEADMKEADQAKAADYITGTLYPLVKEVVEDLTHGT